MTKTPFFTILREEMLRALTFGLSFFLILSLGFVGIAHAANGGLFGELLNKMLVKSWDDPANDGTVKNALKLGGQDASGFVKNPA